MIIHFIFYWLNRLEKNETINAEAGAVVGWSETVTHKIEHAQHIKSALFGGEGMFLSRFSGPGTVFIQTLQLNRLRGLMGSSLCLAPPPIMFMELVASRIKRFIQRVIH